MGWTRVQKAAVSATSNGNAQPTLAFPSNPTVGNYIVAYAWGFALATNPTAVSFSDPGGNSYTVPANAFQVNADGTWCALGYAKVNTSGSSFKVTCTPNQITEVINVCAEEYNPGGGTVSLDGAAVGATGSTGSPAPGSLSFTAGDLVVAVMGRGGTAYTGSTPSGFTRVDFQNDGTNFEVGEAIDALGPTSPTNPTWASGTVSWAAAQFALKSVSATFDPSTNPSWMGQCADRAPQRPPACPWLAAEPSPGLAVLLDPRAYLMPQVPVSPRRATGPDRADPTGAFWLTDPSHAVPGLLAFDVAPQRVLPRARAGGPDYSDPTGGWFIAAPPPFNPSGGFPWSLPEGPPHRWSAVPGPAYSDAGLAGAAEGLAIFDMTAQAPARHRRTYAELSYSDPTAQAVLTVAFDARLQPYPGPERPAPAPRARGPDFADPTGAFWLTDPLRAPILGSTEGAPQPPPRYPRPAAYTAPPGETLGIAAWTAPPPVVIGPPVVPAVQAVAAPPLPAVIDEDTLEAVRLAWLAAGDVTPVPVIDEDTLEAIAGAWRSDAVQLPALFATPPLAGRLKSPQPALYAQVECELLRRELYDTGGFWADVRKVTITIRGQKADVVKAAGAVQAVFGRKTKLVYPSGDRFLKWMPVGDLKLRQDPDTKAGLDVWQGVLEAEVHSIRNH